MSKLKPLRPTTTQMKRMLSKQQPIGAGFLIYKSANNEVGVVEFKVSDTGIMTMLDGSPMIYTCENGTIKHYQIVDFTPAEK
jgi:hypothetical protein